MQNYEVTAVAVFLKAGTLKLTKEQAADRAHNLRDNGDGTFEILHEVCFKRGEKIGYSGELGKAMAEALMTAEQIEAAKAEQQQAAAQQPEPAKRRGRPPKAADAGSGQQAGAGDAGAAGNTDGNTDPLRVE